MIRRTRVEEQQEVKHTKKHKNEKKSFNLVKYVMKKKRRTIEE